MRNRRPRGRNIIPPLLLAVAMLALPGTASPASAATVDGAEIVGAPCEPGVGVTVVVDFTALVDEIHIGCAPGVRTNGFDVLTGAGFTVNDDGTSQGGSLCQVNGLPSQGYPYCWTTGGFWSYWGKNAAGSWGYAPVGAGGGAPRQIDTVEGWSWAPGFTSAPPRVDESVDLDAPVVSFTSAPDATTDQSDATFEFTVDDAAATITCALDGDAAEDCSSPHTISGLANGPHTLVVSATDETGNTGSATHGWTIEAAQAPDTCASTLPGLGGVDEGLDWLACELDANGGLFGSYWDDVFYGDVGMTLDALMAFGINGRADDPAVLASFDALDAEIESYVNGFGDPTDRVAGGTAKALLAGYIAGSGGDHFAPLELEGDLRGLMTTEGDQAGRFQDRNTWGDYSNGFGQAFAIMALSHTTDGVPEASIDFLLDQQCPGGGFRGVYEGSRGCESDSEADTDYTAMALQALLTSPDADGVSTATADAIQWLLDRQDAGTGAFGGTGITAELNTNSSGMIAQGLRAAGRSDIADEAADWIAGLQITTAAAEGGPAAADLGAYAYSPGAFSDGLAGGIDEFARSQWQRATSQAVLAFGAPMFGVVRTAENGEDRTIELSVGSGKVGDEVVVTAAGFDAGELVEVTMYSDPIVLGTATATDSGTVTFPFVIPAVEAGIHRIELVGADSGLVLSAEFEVLADDVTTTDGSAPTTDGTATDGTDSTGSGDGTLSRTGSDITDILPYALAMLLAGAAVVAVTRRRQVDSATDTGLGV